MSRPQGTSRHEPPLTGAISGNQVRTGNWATRGAVAAGRCLVLFGRTLASLVLWMVLLIAIALIPLGVGLPLTAFALNAMRGLQDKTWRRVAGWQGFAVAAPASGPAGDEARDAGFLVRFGALVADPGTWRSLMRSTVDILAGLPLMLAPPVVIVWGLFGLAMPAIWHQLANAHDNNWYAFIHVTTTSTAWLSVVLGIAFIAFGLLLAPEALRHYAALARSLRASD